MAIMSVQETVSDGQSIAAAAGDVAGSNVIKLSGVNCGDGARFFIDIDDAVLSAGAATVQFKVISSASENMGTPTTHFDSGTIAKATLVAGYRACDIPLPRGLAGKYLSTVYTIGTATTTAGKVNAGIVIHTSTNRMPGSAA